MPPPAGESEAEAGVVAAAAASASFGSGRGWWCWVGGWGASWFYKGSLRQCPFIYAQLVDMEFGANISGHR